MNCDKTLDHFIKDRRKFWASCLTFLMVGVIFSYISSRGISRFPWTTGDASSYLNFSETRPHGYPTFLYLYKIIFPDLAHLPAVQNMMVSLSVTALSLAVTIRSGSIGLGLATFAMSSCLRSLDQSGVMSDSLYTTLTTTGTASFLVLISLEKRRTPWLIIASISFGLALITRSIGVVPACAFVSYLMANGWWHRRAKSEVVSAIALIAACVAFAAASNQRHNGEFKIGSWGWVSVLGKSMVIAKATPPSVSSAVLNWIPEKTQRARRSLDGIDDPFLHMLVQRQYYEYLRWFFLWKELDRKGIPFLSEEGDSQLQTARKISLIYIKESPCDYLYLAGYDYLSLWFIPTVLTDREARHLTDKFEQKDVAYLPYWLENEAKGQSYYAVVPNPSPVALVAVIRIGSLGFFIVSCVVTLTLLWRAGLMATLGRHCDILLLFSTVHITYAATALVEAGLERYVSATWPILSSGLMLGTCRFVTLLFDERRRRCTPLA